MCRPPVREPPKAQQQLANAVPRSHQIVAEILTSTHQITAAPRARAPAPRLRAAARPCAAWRASARHVYQS